MGCNRGKRVFCGKRGKTCILWQARKHVYAKRGKKAYSETCRPSAGKRPSQARQNLCSVASALFCTRLATPRSDWLPHEFCKPIRKFIKNQTKNSDPRTNLFKELCSVHNFTSSIQQFLCTRMPLQHKWNVRDPIFLPISCYRVIFPTEYIPYCNPSGFDIRCNFRLQL